MTVTLLLNGAVFDGHRLVEGAEAVAVEDGRIAAVGTTSELRAAAPTGAREVDAAGGLITPGFVDAHVHPVEGGIERMRCDLSAADTREDYLDLVKQYVDANPGDGWVLGGGWHLAAFPGGTPSAGELDAIVGDRPVFLSNRDHHGSWVSSAALRIAGLDASVPDPPDGRVERDAEGNPTGMLQEGARNLVYRHVPRDTEDDLLAGLAEGQRYLHSVGVTGWQDAIVGDYGNHADTCVTYQRADREGWLTGHVVGALWWDRERGREQIPELVERRRVFATERFAPTSVKIMQDGIPENRTAAMIDPYLTPEHPGGCRCGTDERGISFVDPALLPGHVAELDAAGFQVHVHAIGDRAIREALDAFAAARAANGANDARHHIAHVQVVHPADVLRFAALGVAANIQALWATFEPQMVELNVPLLGPERVEWQYPFADLLASGAHLSAGSDWPVTTANPWEAVHVAVNRTLRPDDHDFNPTPFVPGQRLTLAQGLAAYTSGSGWTNRRGGRIAVGEPADLAISDRNPFRRHEIEIGLTHNAATFVAGREVFSS
ncbi:MAG: amidohydrolase [Nocardioidaceae bacterium]